MDRKRPDVIDLKAVTTQSPQFSGSQKAGREQKPCSNQCALYISGIERQTAKLKRNRAKIQKARRERDGFEVE